MIRKVVALAGVVGLLVAFSGNRWGSHINIGVPGVRYAVHFLAGGSDYGAAVNAAYADCLADGNDMCIIQLPRSETLSQSTMIDFCNETGVTGPTGVTLRGHGANRAGASGTLLTASASFRPAAITGAMEVVQDVVQGDGVARDEIRCAACDFRGDGLERGTFITTTDFTNAANNITSSEVPLLVWRAETTTLVVESAIAQDAGLVTEGVGGDEDVQPLPPQVFACARNTRIEGIGFSGGTTNADFGVIFWSDNWVDDLCIDLDDPFDYCTGDAVGSGEANPTVIGTFFEDGWVGHHVWGGIFVTSTNSMGQADATTIRDAEVYSEKYGIWIDNGQAQPSVLVHNVHINRVRKRGLYVSAGGVDFDHSGIITDPATSCSGDACDCANDTYGDCWMAYIEANNIDNSECRNSVIEVTAGDGWHIHPGNSSNSRKTFAFRDCTFLANYDADPTAIKLLEHDQGGGLVLDGSRFNTTASGVTTAPTVTIASSFDGASPLILDAVPVLTVTGSGGSVAPTFFVDDSVQNHGMPVVTHATDCEARTDGTNGQECIELDRASAGTDPSWICVPSAGMCDSAAEWFGPF